jgi:hypothetical protein
MFSQCDIPGEGPGRATSCGEPDEINELGEGNVDDCTLEADMVVTIGEEVIGMFKELTSVWFSGLVVEVMLPKSVHMLVIDAPLRWTSDYLQWKLWQQQCLWQMSPAPKRKKAALLELLL